MSKKSYVYYIQYLSLWENIFLSSVCSSYSLPHYLWEIDLNRCFGFILNLQIISHNSLMPTYYNFHNNSNLCFLCTEENEPQDIVHSPCLVNGWHIEMLKDRVHIFIRPQKITDINLSVITIFIITLLEWRLFRLHMPKNMREIIDLMLQKIFLAKYYFLLIVILLLLTSIMIC